MAQYENSHFTTAAEVFFWLGVGSFMFITTCQNVWATLRKLTADSDVENESHAAWIMTAIIGFCRVCLFLSSIGLILATGVKSTTDSDSQTFSIAVAAHCLMLLFMATGAMELSSTYQAKNKSDEEMASQVTGKAIPVSEAEMNELGGQGFQGVPQHTPVSTPTHSMTMGTAAAANADEKPVTVGGLGVTAM